MPQPWKRMVNEARTVRGAVPACCYPLQDSRAEAQRRTAVSGIQLSPTMPRCSVSDLAAVASANAGGVPGGTALRHAAVFGMANVVEVLLAAGATDLIQAAAAGEITALLTAETSPRERVAALRIAAEHGRLDVIDQLLDAATPVDGVDVDGSTALHEAAYRGRADSVKHLLARGADPGRRDSRFDGTPLGWWRHRREKIGPGHGHEEVEQLLAPVTGGEP